MTPDELIAWRSRMGMTAKAAAEALGLSVNGYAAYERGWTTGYATDGYDRPWMPLSHNSRPRPIPKHVALACERLEQLKLEEVK